MRRAGFLRRKTCWAAGWRRTRCFLSRPGQKGGWAEGSKSANGDDNQCNQRKGERLAEGRRALSRPIKGGYAAIVRSFFAAFNFAVLQVRQRVLLPGIPFYSSVVKHWVLCLLGYTIHHACLLESWRKAGKEHVVTSIDHESKLCRCYFSFTLTQYHSLCNALRPPRNLRNRNHDLPRVPRPQAPNDSDSHPTASPQIPLRTHQNNQSLKRFQPLLPQKRGSAEKRYPGKLRKLGSRNGCLITRVLRREMHRLRPGRLLLMRVHWTMRMSPMGGDRHMEILKGRRV